MKNVTPNEAQKILERKEAIIIDVRTPAEFANGHIKGARNIDIQNPSFLEQIKALDKDTAYVVNCRFGGRSSRAGSFMDELGFKNVMNLDGGIIAWEEEGLPTEEH